MEKIPTAKEFYLKRVFPKTHIESPDEVELWFETSRHSKEDVAIMVEFAKLHVEAALEVVNEKVIENDDLQGDCYSGSYHMKNCYPLENIK